VINVDLNKLFESEKGRHIFSEFLRISREFSMTEKIKNGVIVGFSGGADSVMLLCLLTKHARDMGYPMPVAVHLNHCIRGAEADRDEEFSAEFSSSLGVEFLSFHRDIPALAKELSKGLEETARIARYSIFDDIIRSRNDICAVAIAHNSTDNLETLIFNMMRGAGTRGLSGISPTRGNIIRPLLYCSKADIVSALDYSDVPYVIDSTNLETDYKRNFIRAEILPKFRELCEDPEAQAIRLSRNLREDELYIETSARDFLSEFQGAIPQDRLRRLDGALFYRVISLMAKEKHISIERTHVEKIRELVLGNKKHFSVSLPDRLCFVCADGFCSVDVPKTRDTLSYTRKIDIGTNYVPEIDAEIVLSHEPIEYSSNVYKIAIQECFDFDIIDGDMFVREKRDGDSYVYGGRTRKLKKLFNDSSLTLAERARIPVFCDRNGIFYVQGFRVRDGGKRNAQKKLYLAIAYKA
jgi:tRNA(Ile)-lysidine synthase